MSYAQTRSILQKLAISKVEDALLLHKHGRYSNSYYLAGYGVEIALKACIARHVSAETIPDKRLILDAYTHDFDKLIGAAGLRAELKAEQDKNPVFHTNWGLASQWNPESRYSFTDRSLGCGLNCTST